MMEQSLDEQVRSSCTCSLARVQALSAEIGTFLSDVVLDGFHWEVVNNLIRQRQLLTTTTSDSLAAFSEVLPILTCEAVGGDAKSAIPLAASWWLLLFSAQMLDDAQDQDADWQGQGLHPKQLLPAGVYALSLAQTALTHLDYKLQQRAAPFWLVNEMVAHAIHAQGTERTSNFADLTYDGYFQNTIQKSANLFAVICEVGARLGSAEPEVWARCNVFGMAIGLMKQIQDDCADLHDLNGKSDLMSAHYTLPVIRGLQMSQHPLHSELLRCLQSKERQTAPIAARIKAILSEMQAIQWCLASAEIYRTQAIAALQSLPKAHAIHLINYANS